MKISYVIPCYRSEHTLPSVVEEIRRTMADRPEFDWEVVMTCDHSPDRVYEVIKKMCFEDSTHLKGQLLARNFGENSAVMAGLNQVTGDVIITPDDDGQSPIEATFEMVDKIIEGDYDVIYGAYPDKKHSVFRNIGTKINQLMIGWLIGKPKDVQITSFFAARRFVIDQVIRYEGAFPYVWGLVLRVTQNITNVTVNHRERAEGKSGYTLAKLLGLWMNGFTAFSVKPLRLASLIGAMFAFTGFAYGLWTVIEKLFVNPNVPIGYSSMMSIFLLVSGIVLIMLGLIGEYVGRIYICNNKAPQYVVRERTFQ